jgi:hypothetical protein
MFSMASLFQNIMAKKLGDKMDKLSNAGDAGASLLDDPSQIGGMMKDQFMNRPTIAAGTMSPEEYEEYMRNQILMGQDQSPGMAMPDLPQMDVPFSAGGFVRQTPNYLNYAQQSLGGPYG